MLEPLPKSVLDLRPEKQTRPTNAWVIACMAFFRQWKGIVLTDCKCIKYSCGLISGEIGFFFSFSCQGLLDLPFLCHSIFIPDCYKQMCMNGRMRADAFAAFGALCKYATVPQREAFLEQVPFHHCLI